MALGFIKVKIHAIQPNDKLRNSVLLGEIQFIALEKLVEEDIYIRSIILLKILNLNFIKKNWNL